MPCWEFYEEGERQRAVLGRGAPFPRVSGGEGEESGLQVHPEDVGSLRAAFVSCLWGAGGSPLAAL